MIFVKILYDFCKDCRDCSYMIFVKIVEIVYDCLT